MDGGKDFSFIHSRIFVSLTRYVVFTLYADVRFVPHGFPSDDPAFRGFSLLSLAFIYGHSLSLEHDV